MVLETILLGCGGMLPLPYRHLVSLLIRYEGALFLFDCGEGTQIAFRKANISWKRLQVICISHLHADHVTGLPGLLMLSSQVNRSEPLYIIGPPKLKQYIEVHQKTLEMYINYPLIIYEMDMNCTQIVFETELYYIEAFPLEHKRECMGFSWIEKNQTGRFYPERARAHKVPQGPLWGQLKAGKSVYNVDGDEIFATDVLGTMKKGRKVCYVTDTLANQELICPHVQNADILFCEGMFEQALEDNAHKKMHMSASQAALIAHTAMVKALILIHFSPRYTNAQLQLLEQEARALYETARIGRDGMKIHIPYHEEEKL